jgi:ankyrin repeat protein
VTVWVGRVFFLKKHESELKRLDGALEEIQEFDSLLRHNEYSPSLQFPVDWSDQLGWTLLHCAVKLGCLRSVQSLLKTGANPERGLTADGLEHRSNANGKVASPLFMAKNMLLSMEERSHRPSLHDSDDFQRKGMGEIVDVLKKYRGSTDVQSREDAGRSQRIVAAKVCGIVNAQPYP